MWTKGPAPDQVAQLFHNYDRAVRVFGKGSECACGSEPAEPEKNRMPAEGNTENESGQSHQCFAKPGEQSGAARPGGF